MYTETKSRRAAVDDASLGNHNQCRIGSGAGLLYTPSVCLRVRMCVCPWIYVCMSARDVRCQTFSLLWSAAATAATAAAKPAAAAAAHTKTRASHELFARTRTAHVYARDQHSYAIRARTRFYLCVHMLYYYKVLFRKYKCKPVCR